VGFCDMNEKGRMSY